ncbi:MAG: protease HtpX [Halobacteriovoraceae bacterium]|nr:protease HtpX [Halobacteriovoraceae bacterium]|tara:strand:- start:4706 stop:5596 length:891 start_codon:yes stop_codon:yes gene_type:complete
MNFIKRYGFFIITNLLVSVVLYTIGMFVISQMGYPPGSYAGLFVFCFVFGMGGSFISLAISKWSAKRLMGLEPVASGSALTQKVHHFARRAGLREMPEVYIYQSPEVNAFATGPSRNNSLVAVSTGLMNSMNEDEVDGVLAHEVSHIANGDMVTMTLVQGIVNTFAMFLSYVITQIIMNALRDEDEGDHRGGGSFFIQYMIRNAVYMVLNLLSYPLVMYVSRWREYRADLGSAKIVGKDKMIAALRKLQTNLDRSGKHDKNIEVMAISAPMNLSELFSSHPPLEKRIMALENSREI